MSLINDALRRTQQTAQGSQPPRLADPDLPPLEAIHPPAPPGGSRAKWLIGLLVIAVVLLNLVLWLVFGVRSSRSEAAARTVDAPVPEQAAAILAAEPAPEPAALPPGETVPIVPGDRVTVAAPATDGPVVEPPDIQRPEFHLRTIVIHPSRPSAMINNKVLFVGDRVDGYTVTAIGRDAVTLSLDGDELVISLP